MPSRLLLPCFAVLVSATIVHAEECARDPQDRAAIIEMRDKIQSAINDNRPDLLEKYLDPSFRGTSVTGDPIVGGEQYARFMARARMLMGTGAIYKLELLPKDLKIGCGKAHSSGVTKEEIILPDGKELNYQSEWNIDLKKGDGGWLVSSAEARPNMRDAMTVAAHVVASRIWQAGLNLSRVKLWRPDWDQDGGYHNTLGIEAAQPAPKKLAAKETKRS